MRDNEGENPEAGERLRVGNMTKRTQDIHDP